MRKEDVAKKVREFYDVESKSNDKIAVFTVIGDLKEETNVDFMGGEFNDLIVVIAQSLINDYDIYQVVKASVNVADEYFRLEGLEENDNDESEEEVEYENTSNFAISNKKKTYVS